MIHLTAEELLLFADGEGSRETAAHLDACPACRAALGEWSGRLTAAAAAVRESVPSEPIEAEARAWSRLRRAMHTAASEHLSFEELLLFLDEEPSFERSSHVESCASCREEAARLRLLLGEIEHELRSLIPVETAESRAAARAALRRSMRPAAEVVVFPAPKRLVRVAVAAAAALIGVSALWTVDLATPPENRAASAPVQPSVSESVGIVIDPPIEVAISAPTVEEPAVQEVAGRDQSESGGDAPALGDIEPARFDLAATPSRAPRPTALTEPPPVLQAAVNFAPPPAWSGPPPPTPPVAAAREPIERAEVRTPAQSAATVQGEWLLIRAGAWRRDLLVSDVDGRLVFQGFVEDEADRERLIATAAKAADGMALGWQLRVRNDTPPAPAREIRAMGRPAGGYVRTALLQHYRDAARRSFKTPELDLLESEIARFAGEMFTHQSGLLSHAYAAARLTAAARPALEAGIEPARKAYREALEFHLNGVERHEAAIYDRLSEAVPRKFWNPKSAAEPDDLARIGDAEALLADAIRLEEDLTNRLAGDPSGVDFDQAGATPGELLGRVRRHVDALRKSLRALQ